jgi:two-component system sensor histidine kinase/response regulator
MPSAARHILVAEDNPVNRRVAVVMLENLGFQVDDVTDGADAVKAATKTPYDAILMDCQMPITDGYQATAQIRLLQGASGRTPIIAVTASATRSDYQHCMAAGMDGYLNKPLSRKPLVAALARFAPGEPVLPVADHPAEPAEDVRPVLDARIVDGLRRLGQVGGEDLFGQVATLFLADADTHITATRQALRAGDAAHTLSGAGANIGASGLARLCGTLATVAATGELWGGKVLFDAVEAELGRVRTALTSPPPPS